MPVIPMIMADSERIEGAYMRVVTIPYGKQYIDDTDIQAVIEALRSDWLTQGPAIPAFEKAVADYCGAEQKDI